MISFSSWHYLSELWNYYYIHDRHWAKVRRISFSKDDYPMEIGKDRYFVDISRALRSEIIMILLLGWNIKLSFLAFFSHKPLPCILNESKNILYVIQFSFSIIKLLLNYKSVVGCFSLYMDLAGNVQYNLFSHMWGPFSLSFG